MWLRKIKKEEKNEFNTKVPKNKVLSYCFLFLDIMIKYKRRNLFEEVIDLNKKEVKNILMSMRTQENGEYIDFLLGRIDKIDEEKLQTVLKEVGETEEDIKAYVSKQIEQRRPQGEDKIPINEMFTYGISGKSIHLHLPVDLHPMLAEKGLSATIDTVNLYLLDAMDRIKELKDSGSYKFQNQDIIYMISPILRSREIKFLESMDFSTHFYRKQELKDKEFLKTHPEAQLAVRIFGEEKNVGTASIEIERMNSKEWQDKKNGKIKEFKEKGITIEKSSKEKE